MNKAILIGRLGQDPELKYSQTGSAICNFSLATSERWKNKSGEQQEKTEWHRCVCFGKQAEVIQKYVRKGDQFCVEGKVEYQKYEKDGIERYSTQINVRNFEFISGGKREENTDYNAPQNLPNDDDIPF